MDALNGDIVCNLEKWCKLVAALSAPQRARLAETSLRSMLQIPCMKIRAHLIRFMVECFDPTTSRFRIRDHVGEISASRVDVECIFNLADVGLSATEILAEEGNDIKDHIPAHFLSRSTENIVIDDLISDIIKNKSTDDDFLRRVVLVLLGTVLAPMHLKIVPKQYYALVVDVPRISRINWNAFTLSVLLDCLRIVRKGKHLRQWPKGNLALMQVYTYTIFFLKSLIIYAIACTNHNSSCPCSTCIGRRPNLWKVIALSIPACSCNLL